MVVIVLTPLITVTTVICLGHMIKHILTDLSIPHAPAPRSRPQRWGIAIVLFLLAVGAIALSHYGWQHSLLFGIGGILGVTLYHSSFGFASAYRKLFVHHQVQGMYAQVLMLAIATLLFAPVLAMGTVGGQPLRGAIAPVGIPGAIGAFLFGIGMQLGGACGCGTLYSIGGGSLTLILTLITFCLGAFGASLTRQLWAGLPATEPIVLGNTFGWVGAVLVQWGLLAVAAGLLYWWSQRQPTVEPPASPPPIAAHPHPPNLQGWLQTAVSGPWSLAAGAIALAILNWLTLLLSGQPWRITWGFALWAAQLAQFLGWDSQSSAFWQSESAQRVLQQSVFADVSSVMNIGIILGAILAAALAGRWLPKGKWTGPQITRTLTGGLIMGYGAFLAAGCNVSAFFSGIASTSLHGWLWILFALLGTTVGIRLRSLIEQA